MTYIICFFGLLLLLTDPARYDGGNRLRRGWNCVFGRVETRRNDDHTASRTPRTRYECQRGWQSSLASQTLQQTRLLQSLSQHARGVGQKGAMLYL